ncbi:POT family-domain-containing protein [Auriculariales sp. MPI-PUGE-AT-0066]|nr:POT family-domain-containing protein [Auriculariales sp. MPI-PUGE-AT-0066]
MSAIVAPAKAVDVDTHSVDEKKHARDVYSVDHEPVDLIHDVYDPDAIVEGSIDVTYRELETLRLVPDKLNISSFLVIVVEFAERWSYYGTLNVLNNYIRAPLPAGSTTGAPLPENRANGIAGALDKGQQVSFAIRTFNSFWFYITPLIGGVVSDCYLGKFNTILYFTILYIIGHIVLVASAIPQSIANPDRALGLLAFAVVIMGIGGGAIKSNVGPLIGEQYTGKMRKQTLKSGEVVIISPSVTYQRIYNWFYAAINWGATGAISASFLARDHGFWQAFLVPTCILGIVPIVLLAGRKSYIVTPPRGSIVLETLRVIRLCAGERWSWSPAKFYKNVQQPGFWDIAKPSNHPKGEVPAAITWDDEFVSEVVRALKACRVFLVLPFFYLCYSQIDGNLGTVAAGMTLNGTPNDLVQNLNPICLVIGIPILDSVFYPFLRKHKINFTPIKRITFGFFIAGLAMLYAAILQKYIYESSPCHDNLPSECTKIPPGGTKDDAVPDPSPLNVWIVAGPYILVAIAEMFTSLVANEYAFTKAPKRMRSTVSAFALLMSALSAAINFTLTSVNTEDKFTWLFGSFAIVAWLTGIIFWFFFRGLDKQELRLNQIGTGVRRGFQGEDAEVTYGVHHHGEEGLGKKGLTSAA